MGKTSCLLFFYAVLTIACNIDVKTGVPSGSNDVVMSKAKGVFFREYYCENCPLVINDSLKIDVSDVWVERGWHYDYDKSNNLILVTTSDSLSYYNLRFNFLGIVGKNILNYCIKDKDGYHAGILSSKHNYSFRKDEIIPNILEFRLCKHDTNFRHNKDEILGTIILKGK